ncbi:MAG TPA: holo-ACP synthase [Gemmatimonadaceae bacterium]|nr:holo-ACP synthase [Gemmatimonadaceae bacterium]
MIVGLGVDVVEIDRVRRLIAGPNERAIARLFTDAESRYALARADPATHLAARVAAKEAAYKALAGNSLARAVGWREIEVALRDDGAPFLLLHGRAQQRATELEIARVLVSLTHSRTAAVAFVILER